MGIQSQLNDVASDSIPLILLAFIAISLTHLRSLLLSLLRFIGTSAPPPQSSPDGILGAGLAGLILLSEQLNLNRELSYKYDEVVVDDAGAGMRTAAAAPRYCGGDCVVCLCSLKEGQRVRRLNCRHVFHKECLDGWLDQMNFNCPLCFSPLVSGDLVCRTQRSVSGGLVERFALERNSVEHGEALGTSTSLDSEIGCGTGPFSTSEWFIRSWERGNEPAAPGPLAATQRPPYPTSKAHPNLPRSPPAWPLPIHHTRALGRHIPPAKPLQPVRLSPDRFGDCPPTLPHPPHPNTPDLGRSEGPHHRRHHRHLPPPATPHRRSQGRFEPSSSLLPNQLRSPPPLLSSLGVRHLSSGDVSPRKRPPRASTTSSANPSSSEPISNFFVFRIISATNRPFLLIRTVHSQRFSRHPTTTRLVGRRPSGASSSAASAAQRCRVSV
ncbi:E3 ubiquitin-protein ligase [Dionaea muscipula]